MSGPSASPPTPTAARRGEVGTGQRLSIVIPFFDEVEAAPAVLDELGRLFPDAEVVAVDDGSSDGTWEQLRGRPGVRAVRLSANRGQSAALWVGLQHATRDVCVLMDGDGQNDPCDIPALVAALADADVACGYRRRRRDPWNKRIASRVANAVRRAVLGDGVRDTGCALKAFAREHVRHLVPFDGMHRFLPALFRAAGLRIVEVPVEHRPRRYGASKYDNLARGLRGAHDLFGVRWLLRRKINFPRVEVDA